MAVCITLISYIDVTMHSHNTVHPVHIILAYKNTNKKIFYLRSLRSSRQKIVFINDRLWVNFRC